MIKVDVTDTLKTIQGQYSAMPRFLQASFLAILLGCSANLRWTGAFLGTARYSQLQCNADSHIEIFLRTAEKHQPSTVNNTCKSPVQIQYAEH